MVVVVLFRHLVLSITAAATDVGGLLYQDVVAYDVA